MTRRQPTSVVRPATFSPETAPERGTTWRATLTRRKRASLRRRANLNARQTAQGSPSARRIYRESGESLVRFERESLWGMFLCCPKCAAIAWSLS